MRVETALGPPSSVWLALVLTSIGDPRSQIQTVVYVAWLKSLSAGYGQFIFSGLESDLSIFQKFLSEGSAAMVRRWRLDRVPGF